MATTRRLNSGDSVLDRWADGVSSGMEEVNNDIDQLGNSVDAVASSTAAVVADTADPTDVNTVSATESGYIVDGVLYSEVVATYHAPSPLGNFAGIYLVAKDYRGSSELVKIAEHKFAGAAGGTVSFRVTLQRTNETITLYFVAKNFSGGSKDDWSTSPSTTVVLDGNASAPTTVSGLSGTATNTGISLSWTANIENNLAGYKVYRGTTNVFGSATLLNNVGTTRSGSPSYFDATGSYITIYYYWVTAVNTASQESSSGSPVAVVSGGNAVTGIIAQGNFGFLNDTTSIQIYWDGTHSSLVFTLRLADGSTLSVPTSSITVTGLIASNTYKFFPYYDVLSGAVSFATGGVGTPAIAFGTTAVGGEVVQSATVLATTASSTNAPGKISLSTGPIVSSTPAAGPPTGGSDGGSSLDCLAPWMTVQTKEGEVVMEDLEVGDFIDTPSGWSEVVAIKYPPQTHLVQIKTGNGNILECSPLHPVALADSTWRYAAELKEGDYVITKKGASKITSWLLREYEYDSVLPSLNPHHDFFCNGILTHNMQSLDKF